jgi:DNA repair protein RadA/Sms
VNELGVFAMTEKGLRGVTNPSALFLSQHGAEVAGSCVMVTQEGTRPLLVEIQALVDEAHAPNPRRLTVGPGAEPARAAARGAAPPCRHRLLRPGRLRQRRGRRAHHEPRRTSRCCWRSCPRSSNRPLPAKLVVFGEVGTGGRSAAGAARAGAAAEAAKLGGRRQRSSSSSPAAAASTTLAIHT